MKESAETAVVVRSLPNRIFELELGDGSRVRAGLGDEFKLKTGRLRPGEKVLVELSPYDLGRGRIVGRIPD